MRFDFPTLSKVSGILRVVLHLDSELLLVYGFFALLLAHLGVRAPILYVQDAILNLRHPYIVITTAITDSLNISVYFHTHYMYGISHKKVYPSSWSYGCPFKNYGP